MTEKPDPPDNEARRLAAWNRRRRAFARKTGLPYIPVLSDRNAPAVDEELIRKLIAGELDKAEGDRIFAYCWWYPSWIRAHTRLSTDRLWRGEQSRE